MIVRQLSECAALITGSTSGIGLEIAAQLAEAGVSKVMLNGRNPARGEQARHQVMQRSPGTEARFLPADLTNQAEAKWLADETAAAFGSIDILVTSVSGTLPPLPFHLIPPDSIDASVRASFLAPLYICHAALPHLIEREGGVILNIASDAGKVATPGEVVIGACKGAVLMMTRTLALEASRHGIRVHAISPSIVKDTASYDRVMASEFSRKLFEKAERRARLGVPGPGDIASLAVYLASPAAARMTGQVVSVNGGISVA